ncbi:Uncharacterized protein PBTT_05788 [Plasmodiophora brassicae]
MTSVKVTPEAPPLVVDVSAANFNRPAGASRVTLLVEALKLLLVTVSAPAAISIAFTSADFAPATKSFEASQWAWALFFTFLNTSWFVVFACGTLNLFVDKPGCHVRVDFVMVLCVFLNTIIVLGIPYAFGVYPILFFAYISSTILVVISRRVSFTAMGRDDVCAQPSDVLLLSAKKTLKLRAMVSTTFNIHLLVVVVSLVCFNLVSSNHVVIQAAIGFVTASITIASRLTIPFMLFDRMKLDENRQLRLDPNIRAYWTFYLEMNSEVYFNLAFPSIHSPIIFGVIVAVQMLSMIVSSLWLFPRFADWMSASPNAQSPWSQVGIVTKLGVKLFRPSSFTSVPSSFTLVPSMDKWHDVARLVVFMRWLAKVTATMSFMTLYSLGFFSYNGRYMAFQANNADQYWRVINMTFVSFICENAVLVGMSIASSFAFKDWNDPNNVSFFARGFHLLRADSKAHLFIFASMFNIMSIAIGMFIQHTNWLYTLYSVH